MAAPSAEVSQFQFEMHFNEEEKAGSVFYSLLANGEGSTPSSTHSSTHSSSVACDAAADDEEDADAAEVIDLLPLR